MFKQICIKPTENKFPTDIGLIAENLLYYEKVNLIASTDTIPELLNNCDIGVLNELVASGKLNLLIKENVLGTMSTTLANGNIINDVALLYSDNLTVEEFIFRSIFNSSDRRGYSKRTSKRLLDIVKPIKYEDGICDLIRNDLDDEDYVKQTIIDTIKLYNPELILRQEEIRYEKVKIEKGFFFLTNLDFEKINKRIPNNPDGKLINSTGLILNIQEARGDMHLAASLDSEIATSAIQTQLMKLKFKDIYQKSNKTAEEVYQFNDFVLDNGHAIREVLNSGEKSFSDFLKVLDKADKFKNWLTNVDKDKTLIKSYHEEVTKETWVDKLPTKGFRWSFFTGLGLLVDAAGGGGLGTAVGLGLSAGDTFLLDKILKGWKPNVFVNNELIPMINKK